MRPAQGGRCLLLGPSGRFQQPLWASGAAHHHHSVIDTAGPLELAEEEGWAGARSGAPPALLSEPQLLLCGKSTGSGADRPRAKAHPCSETTAHPLLSTLRASAPPLRDGGKPGLLSRTIVNSLAFPHPLLPLSFSEKMVKVFQNGYCTTQPGFQRQTGSQTPARVRGWTRRPANPARTNSTTFHPRAETAKAGAPSSPSPLPPKVLQACPPPCRQGRGPLGGSDHILPGPSLGLQSPGPARPLVS